MRPQKIDSQLAEKYSAGGFPERRFAPPYISHTQPHEYIYDGPDYREQKLRRGKGRLFQGFVGGNALRYKKG